MDDLFTQKFSANLQRGGTGLPEMIRMLEAYADHGDINVLKEQVYKQNLLGKTSTDMTQDAFLAFRRRFIRVENMPPTILLSLMARKSISDAARAQLLLPYFLTTDPMVACFYQGLVLNRLLSLKPALEVAEVRNYFEQIGPQHPEITQWSVELRRRWARGFISFLRQFSILEPHPGTSIRRLWLSCEPFGFFWMWLWESGGSYWAADQSKWWSWLQVDERLKNDLLSEGQLRGWWQIQRAGEIVQFQPKYSDLKGWIEHGLE